MLSQSLSFREVSNVVLIGANVTVEDLNPSAKITCSSYISGPIFDFENIVSLSVQALTITGCGEDTIGCSLLYMDFCVFKFTNIFDLHMSQVAFVNNSRMAFWGINILGNSIIANSTFEWNGYGSFDQVTPSYNMKTAITQYAKNLVEIHMSSAQIKFYPF